MSEMTSYVPEVFETIVNFVESILDIEENQVWTFLYAEANVLHFRYLDDPDGTKPLLFDCRRAPLPHLGVFTVSKNLKALTGLKKNEYGLDEFLKTYNCTSGDSAEKIEDVVEEVERNEWENARGDVDLANCGWLRFESGMSDGLRKERVMISEDESRYLFVDVRGYARAYSRSELRQDFVGDYRDMIGNAYLNMVVFSDVSVFANSDYAATVETGRFAGRPIVYASYDTLDVESIPALSTEIEPSENVKRHLRYIYRNLAGCNEYAFKCHIAYIAECIQSPFARSGKALFMTNAVSGIGKDLVYGKPRRENTPSFMQKVFHRAHINCETTEDLTQRFTEHLIGKAFCCVGESGERDKGNVNRLKSIISANRLIRDRKNRVPVEVPNISHFVFAANTGSIRTEYGLGRRAVVIPDAGIPFDNDREAQDFIDTWSDENFKDLVAWYKTVDYEAMFDSIKGEADQKYAALEKADNYQIREIAAEAANRDSDYVFTTPKGVRMFNLTRWYRDHKYSTGAKKEANRILNCLRMNHQVGTSDSRFTGYAAEIDSILKEGADENQNCLNSTAFASVDFDFASALNLVMFRTSEEMRQLRQKSDELFITDGLFCIPDKKGGYSTNIIGSMSKSDSFASIDSMAEPVLFSDTIPKTHATMSRSGGDGEERPMADVAQNADAGQYTTVGIGSENRPSNLPKPSRRKAYVPPAVPSNVDDLSCDLDHWDRIFRSH